MLAFFVVLSAFVDGVQAAISTECGMRLGDKYILCEHQKETFFEDGLGILTDIITEEEMLPIEHLYSQYMREGSSDIQGKDFCDMSQPFGTPRSEYRIVNAMLPSRYYPDFQGNTYERVAHSIASQLFPDVEMVFDYDQLLDKTPLSSSAVFPWHQDMAYWPTPLMTPDTRTVTFSLALDSTTIDNGCIRYVAKTGLSKELRTHRSMGSGRDENHAIGIDVGDDENVSYAEVSRNSVSIHDEYVVHGSNGNNSPNTRRTYVIAFRAKDTVIRERAAGFTHSHNDAINWDVFNKWSESVDNDADL